MRVLVTGCTSKQLGKQRSFACALNGGSLVDVLRLNGHEVDWREVVPGEDLAGYHRVVVLVGALNALTARYAYGMLWALASRPDAFYLLEGWYLHQITSSAKSVVKYGPERLFKPILAHWAHKEEARAVHGDLMRAVEELAGMTHFKGRRCLTPMFRNGQPDAPGFLRHCPFDPTVLWLKTYGDLVKPVGMLDKKKQWVHASMYDKGEWCAKQGFTWPVVSYGIKRLNQPRVEEVDLLPVFAENWGVVSAPHSRPLSGWWRIRYVISAVCGNVLYGDKRELQTTFGPEHPYSVVSALEKFDVSELAERARMQRAALEAQMMPLDELKTKVEEYMA
jgi:hypothetical protein